jgi:hypothetical protein
MKTKILIVVALVLIVGASVIVVLQSRRGFTIEQTHLPQVMSNYAKTFKLDTSPAYFPDGKSNVPAKTNLLKP